MCILRTFLGLGLFLMFLWRIKSLRKSWNQLTAYFKYAQPIRKIIYTTNTVEGFNRQLRKITKSKAVFPNEDALLKLIWLVSQNILKKWTSPLQKWALTAQQPEGSAKLVIYPFP